MTAQYTPRIKRRITGIDVSEDLTFAHPFARPEDYRSVAQEILGNKIAKMSPPDGEKTSFLLHAVYCGPEKFQSKPEAIELRDDIMSRKYLWLFQVNKWVPAKYPSAHGVFVVYDEKGVGPSEELDIGDLEKALKGGRKLKNEIRFSEDGKTSFAPRNTYGNGEMTPEDFANDGFIIASNKEQGAENLARVSASKHFTYKMPRSWIVEPDETPIQSVSAVRGYYGIRLDFNGGCHVGGGGGCAFGVLE